MNRIKVGDYAIPPKGCNKYLTAGKKYEIIVVFTCGFFKIQDNVGDVLFCCLNNCCHLKGKNWTIKKKPNNHEHSIKSTPSV